MSKIQNKRLCFRDLRFSASDLFRISDFGFRASSGRGFALIELLIAVVLFGIISTFILIAYGKVSRQLFLTTLAYEVALSFREAQSYGVSVHQFQGAGGQPETFDVGYGLHFDRGSMNTYALFSDSGGVAGNSVFDGTFGTSYTAKGCVSLTECISVSRIEKGNLIYKFCGVLPLGDKGRDVPDNEKQEECNINSLPATNSVISFLDVTFLRPNPDAIITTDRTIAVKQKYKAARIYLIAPSGDKRVVEVNTTGEISIK